MTTFPIENLEKLGNLNSDPRLALLLPKAVDILMFCQIEGHSSPDIEAVDQVMSAMTCLVQYIPDGVFKQAAISCPCPAGSTPVRKQAVAFLGLAGYLSVAKEITDTNKSYISKRWHAFCNGEKVTNIIPDTSMETLVKVAMNAQYHLHQTDIGRLWCRILLERSTFPEKLKDQILMVYKYSGMKAAHLMNSYLGMAPVALALSAVGANAVAFRIAYDQLQEAEGANFPYTKLLGRGHELNNANFPDLYYCALTY